MRYGKPYNNLRRDSGTSDDFLTVESAMMQSNGNGSTGGIGIGGVRANVGVIGGLLKNPGSMSSRCFNNPPITPKLAFTPSMPIPPVPPFPVDCIMADSTVKKSLDAPESQRRLL